MRGEKRELICDVGDHSVSEEEEVAAGYDKITEQDKALGISKETCLSCRSQLRKKDSVLIPV